MRITRLPNHLLHRVIYPGIFVLATSLPVGAQTAASVMVDHSAHTQAVPEQTSTAHDAHLHIEDDTELGATAYSTEIDDLPPASPVQTVELKHGDTFNITAAYVKKAVGNRTLRMLAYNGSVPGPFIKAPQGAEITIEFTNNTDIDQTIHSHGVRVDNLSDGVPGLTQDSVKPGEHFTYTIKFIDAGVFWYHPHTREDYGQELGLYGNYLISPSSTGYWNDVDREIPLVIDDLLIENDRIARFYQEFTNYALLGRFGNHFLVNGETAYTLNVRQGELVRFFVTNVSNARTYNLSMPGVPLKMVGADLGRFEREALVKDFLISPAERIVVETCFAKPGHYTLMHTLPDRQVELATLHVSAAQTTATDCTGKFNTVREHPDVIEEFAGYRDRLDDTPDRNLLLTITLAGQQIDHSLHAHAAPAVASEPDLTDHSGMDHADHSGHDMAPALQTVDTELDQRLKQMQWDDPEHSDRTQRTPEVNWKLVDQGTGMDGNNIDDWVFTQGELVKIRLLNDMKADHIMQHPIHLHGQQFVVLAYDGVANPNLAWKDTALVMPGQTLDILVKMTNTGMWMLHCHISEHLHAGMSLNFRVEDAQGRARGDDYRAGAQLQHQH